MEEFIRCCPFCGSHEVEISRTNKNACWVECHICSGRSTSHPARKAAIKEWNRRFFDDRAARIVQDDDKEQQNEKY